jgi:hypothetical protein
MVTTWNIHQSWMSGLGKHSMDKSEHVRLLDMDANSQAEGGLHTRLLRFSLLEPITSFNLEKLVISYPET